MTAIASPAPRSWSPALPTVRVTARVVAAVAALCLLLGAGIALASLVATPAGGQTPSQQPAATSPAP